MWGEPGCAHPALQGVGEAVDVTREFLFPFELRRWLKLTVVAFFLALRLAFAVVVAIVVFVVVATLLVLAALVQVPLLAFLRYYALLVLGGVEPSLDLVGQRRPADGTA